MDHSLNTLLNKNPITNMAAIGFFNNYPLDNCYIKGENAILLGTSDYQWCHIISDNPDELKHLLNKINPLPKRYFSIEDWMIPIIEALGEKEWLMNTHRYIFKADTVSSKSSIPTISLNSSFSEYIYTHSEYKQYLSIEYIEDRLKKDISAGIFDNNLLIAWGFTHDDGALGFLHVLDMYRKKGLGKDIVLKLIEERKYCKTPVFCNIVPENITSIHLVKKLGFDFDRSVSWLKLK